MKLLILTQKIDKNDDLLGFFHGWLAAFAGHFEKITVIALGVGQYDLPNNVNVLSLGKETGQSRLKYLVRFYKYIWQERKKYEAVFIHMNQEYAILGGIFWRLWGKKIFLWRNHLAGGFWVRPAVFLVNTVFCTSPFAFVKRYRKTRLMPAGIDTDFFQPDPAIKKDEKSILYLGRISPIKKIDILIEALNLMKKQSLDFKVKIIGDAPPRDEKYLTYLRTKVTDYQLENNVNFLNGIRPDQAPLVYNQNEIFVNMTLAGSLDKTIYEAMACESLVLVANKSLAGEVDEKLIFNENDPVDLAEKIKNLLDLPPEQASLIKKKLRQIVLEKHGLNKLIEELTANFNL